MFHGAVKLFPRKNLLDNLKCELVTHIFPVWFLTDKMPKSPPKKLNRRDSPKPAETILTEDFNDIDFVMANVNIISEVKKAIKHKMAIL